MKWLKRCVLSITRRPVKSLLLFLVVFAMGNLLAGSLAIITTSKTVKDEIKRGLGAEAAITGHFREQYGSKDIDFDEMRFNYDVAVSTLAKQEYVDYGEYHYATNAYSNYGGTRMGYTLISTNISEPEELRSGEYKFQTIQNARMFTAEEIEQGAMVALVSQDLGKSDEFSTGFTVPGNTLTINIPLATEVVLNENGEYIEKSIDYSFDVTVVGVFRGGHSSEVYIPSTTFMNAYKAADGYAKKLELSPMSYEVRYAAYKLKDTAYLEEFDALAVSLLEKLPDNFEYTSSSESYDRSAGPVENLDTIAKVIFITSVVATVIILGLVIVFFISDRKKEIGIYASLGERKKNVVLQILCEIVLISTLAIASASLSGIFVGNKLSDYMLEVQRYVKRKQDLGVIADLPVLYKPIKDGLTSYSRDEVIDNYNAKPTGEYFAVLYAVGEITIIVSCVVPMAYLTCLKPKDIMI